MRATATITLATATYSTHRDAMRDFDDTWRLRHEGRLHHIATAVLTRDADGLLRVERSKNTAKHLAWGGALLGGALFLVAPTAGAGMLTSVGLRGAGVIIAHFHDHLRPEDVASGGRLLMECPYAVVVVMVVNHEVQETMPPLRRAIATSSMATPWGELDDELGWDRADHPLEAVLVPT
jgi:hypothetical protein